MIARRPKIIPGMRFGTYLVLADGPPSAGGARRVLCRCDCGIERLVQTSNLHNGNSRSCGRGACSTRGQTTRERYGYPEPGAQARNYIFLNHQSRARQMGRAWELAFEEFCEITSRPCIYCGAEQSNCTHDKNGLGAFRYNGIDRVDSSQGYVRGNVVTACVMCNRAKSDMGLEDFIAWAKRIAVKYQEK